MQDGQTKPRKHAKRLTRKEMMYLIEKAFLDGEKLGRANMDSIIRGSYPVQKPANGFQSWIDENENDFDILKSSKYYGCRVSDPEVNFAPGAMPSAH